MAIAPITGTHIRRTFSNITLGMTFGALGGSYYWYWFHKPLIAKREEYYASLAKQKEELEA
ncbi:cytochrome c oxidase subunit VIIa [Hanseniaspora uvarum]|nr:cytochrome c oxidase subunit VIIa [Hanseniaspora uvarum]